MRITIEYPYVMKIQVRSEIEISNPPSLKEIQKKIFNGFWQSFIHAYPHANKHGNWSDVNISDGYHPITDSKILQEALKITNHFQVVFTDRHQRGDR